MKPIVGKLKLCLFLAAVLAVVMWGMAACDRNDQTATVQHEKVASGEREGEAGELPLAEPEAEEEGKDVGSAEHADAFSVKNPVPPKRCAEFCGIACGPVAACDNMEPQTVPECMEICAEACANGLVDLAAFECFKKPLPCSELAPCFEATVSKASEQDEEKKQED